MAAYCLKINHLPRGDKKRFISLVSYEKTYQIYELKYLSALVLL